MTREENPGCLAFLFGGGRSRNNDYSVEYTHSGKKTRNYNYYVNNRFLTPAEHSFYLVALKVLGDGYMLCPQVNMAAIFGIEDEQNYMAAFHRISQKRVDFIVCDSITMKILFGIELDDSSHKRKTRKERDAFVEQVFESAHLPLLRINVRESYSTYELRSKFDAVLGRSSVEKPVPVERSQTESPKEDTASITGRITSLMPPAACPNCGSPFGIRVSTAGPNVGRKFYVCTRYPDCKTSIKIEE